MKFKNYFKKEQKLILWGVVVGLILGVGVWLVVLNDFGTRLATVGAFVAAILTPVLAFIVNNFIPASKHTAVDPDNTPDSTPRNSRIIVISSLIALIVTVGVVWATPRVINSVQNYFYHTLDTETVEQNSIMIEHNSHMKNGDKAHLILPHTSHRELTIRFAVKNDESTTLCANAATLKINLDGGKDVDATPDADISLTLNPSKDQHHITAELVFLPETDPSCTLNLSVASLTYSK